MCSAHNSISFSHSYKLMSATFFLYYPRFFDWNATVFVCKILYNTMQYKHSGAACFYKQFHSFIIKFSAFFRKGSPWFVSLGKNVLISSQVPDEARPGTLHNPIQVRKFHRTRKPQNGQTRNSYACITLSMWVAQCGVEAKKQQMFITIVFLLLWPIDVHLLFRILEVHCVARRKIQPSSAWNSKQLMHTPPPEDDERAHACNKQKLHGATYSLKWTIGQCNFQLENVSYLLISTVGHMSATIHKGN